MYKNKFQESISRCFKWNWYQVWCTCPILFMFCCCYLICLQEERESHKETSSLYVKSDCLPTRILDCPLIDKRSEQHAGPRWAGRLLGPWSPIESWGISPTCSHAISPIYGPQWSDLRLLTKPTRSISSAAQELLGLMGIIFTNTNCSYPSL